MARPVGSRQVEVEQMKTIVRLTLEGEKRPDIAEAAGVSNRWVYNFQREFALI